MKLKKVFSCLLTGLLFCSASYSHHPIALLYTTDETVSVNGVLTRVIFASPHTYLFIQSNEGGDEAQKWQVEWSSFPSLNNFWNINKGTLKPGSLIKVTAYASKEFEAKMLMPMEIETDSGIRWRRMDK